MHTTNYISTFIQIADDCPLKEADVPAPGKKEPSIAELQFKMIYDNPYKYTSDDVLFEVYAQRNGIKASEKKAAREAFFSKGQACLRASPLTKRWGWGVHNNEEGKVAIYAAGSAEYKKLMTDKSLKQTKAMRSSRA
ncbi:MAG: DUF6157 family protein [Bacteroidia bacterium]|jgi:hypothetical protein|nr:DUF6157 family protein [Bacteroidia bacterium]